VCLISLAIFTVVEVVAVLRIDIPAVDSTVSFAIGLGGCSKPPCLGLSRSECVTTKLTLNEIKISSYFGDLQVNLTKLALVVTYVVFMTTFGAVVGLTMLRQPPPRAAHSI